MIYTHVAIASVAHVDAPIRLSSDEIMQRLAPTLERLGIRDNLFADVAGIAARRIWDGAAQPSDAATWAAQRALAASGVPHEKIGILVNTSVCRDYLEPSTASLIHSNLKMPASCRNYDLGNACLAFVNAIELVGTLLERGDIEYGLVVDGDVRSVVAAVPGQHPVQRGTLDLAQLRGGAAAKGSQ